MKRVLIATCAMASLVIGLGWQVSAVALPLEGPHAAALGTSSSFSSPGGSLTVFGQNFAAGESILLTLFSQPESLGSAKSNGIGSFSTQVTIPSDAALGDHTIFAKGATGDSASTGITLVVVNQATIGPSIASLGSGTAASTPLRLGLSRITLVPGEPTVLSGRGCSPGQKVVVSINGKEVDQIRANSHGAFSTSLTPLDQGVGQVTVDAVCGSKKFVAIATLVTTAKASVPAGSVAAFGSFVLLGAVLLRGQFGSTAARRRRRRRGASDILGTG